MNDEGRPAKNAHRPISFADRNTEGDLEMELEHHLAGEWAAIEALEAEDPPRAERILRDLVATALEPVQAPKLLCPRCGLDCRWPGRLEQHLLVVHDVDLEEAA